MSVRHYFISSLLAIVLATPAWSVDSVVENVYGFELRVSKPGDKIDLNNPVRIAVQVALEREARRLWYQADEGKFLAVVQAPKEIESSKKPELLHRFAVPVRGFEEEEFAEKTQRVAVAAYRDANTGNIIYVSDGSAMALLPAANVKRVENPGEPKWLGRLSLRIRRGGETDFNFPHLKLNVEAYRDDHTGCVVYVGENGALAVYAAKEATMPAQPRKPEWSHSFDLRARRIDEFNFTAKTTRMAMEIYRDPDRSTWIYATDQLRLTAAPAGKPFDTMKVQDVKWTNGVRTKKGAAFQWAAEAYTDPNSGQRMFATPLGGLAVIAD